MNTQQRLTICKLFAGAQIVHRNSWDEDYIWEMRQYIKKTFHKASVVLLTDEEFGAFLDHAIARIFAEE